MVQIGRNTSFEYWLIIKKKSKCKTLVTAPLLVNLSGVNINLLPYTLAG